MSNLHISDLNSSNSSDLNVSNLSQSSSIRSELLESLQNSDNLQWYLDQPKPNTSPIKTKNSLSFFTNRVLQRKDEDDFINEANLLNYDLQCDGNDCTLTIEHCDPNQSYCLTNSMDFNSDTESVINIKNKVNQVIANELAQIRKNQIGGTPKQKKNKIVVPKRKESLPLPKQTKIVIPKRKESLPVNMGMASLHLDSANKEIDIINSYSPQYWEFEHESDFESTDPDSQFSEFSNKVSTDPDSQFSEFSNKVSTDPDSQFSEFNSDPDSLFSEFSNNSTNNSNLAYQFWKQKHNIHSELSTNDSNFDSQLSGGKPQFHGKKSKVMVKVPKSVANAAQKAFDLKKKGFKGAIATGIKRGRQLTTKKEISIKDLRYMRNWYARHYYTSKPTYDKWVKAGRPKTKEWHNKRGIIAWLIWGGNPGLRWVNSKINLLNKHFNKQYKRIGK